MECGSEDVLCQILTWVSENELASGWVLERLAQAGRSAEGVVGALSQFARDYGQSIIGLFGVMFGFWRWWRYREHILHKRLSEYLGESDARLRDGHAQLLEAIQRPRPGLSFKEPLFVDEDLRSVLRERYWDRTALALTVARSSDWQLTKSVNSIKRRLKTVEDAANSLHLQLSAAYSLRGAIAASEADRNSSWGGNFSHRALNFFRSALSVPGHERNILLKELEAHQLRKLAHLGAAEHAYKEVITAAEGLDQQRERNVLTSRAKRYLAEITWVDAPLIAFKMMTADAATGQYYPGALFLISNCEPLNVWERLEKGDMHYFCAVLAKRLNFVIVEQNQLNEAEAAYQRVLLELPKRNVLWPTKFVRLRARAIGAQQRVADARNGNYDVAWLPQPLQQPQQGAANIGSTSGN